MRHLRVAVLTLVTLPCLAASAPIAISLDQTTPLAPADVDGALRQSRDSDARRERFHALYRVPVQSDFVDRLEVITEYRRLVLIGEERLAAGEWTFATTARAAQATLQAWTGKVTVRAVVRFNPLKSYPRPPAVSVLVSTPTGQVMPLDVRSNPLYATQAPDATTPPLIGVVVDGIFDAAAVGRRERQVTIYGPEGERLQVTVNFGGMK